jgi:hypothetical protein
MSKRTNSSRRSRLRRSTSGQASACWRPSRIFGAFGGQGLSPPGGWSCLAYAGTGARWVAPSRALQPASPLADRCEPVFLGRHAQQLEGGGGEHVLLELVEHAERRRPRPLRGEDLLAGQVHLPLLDRSSRPCGTRAADPRPCRERRVADDLLDAAAQLGARHCRRVDRAGILGGRCRRRISLCSGAASSTS